MTCSKIIVGLAFAVATTPAEFEKLLPEWQALHDRLSPCLFGSAAWYALWWRHLGQNGGQKLRIVTARRDGNLVAVLPLVMRRAKGLRVIEWAGHEVFDYGDVLAESAGDAKAAWDYARFLPGDILLIKDVRDAALSQPLLAADMQCRETQPNYALVLEQVSGEAWLAAQSRKLRGDTRRKREKLETQGAVAFHVFRSGDMPRQVVEALITQKSAWFVEQGYRGAFEQKGIKGFLRDLASDAAARGILYLGWLTCGDRIIACHLGFVKNGVLYLYHTSFDTAFGVHSPGNILMVETIQWACDSGLREVDFMRGGETYKTRFANQTRGLSAFVEGRSWLGRLALKLHRKKEKAVSGEAADQPQ